MSRIYPWFLGEKAFKLLTLTHAATTNYWSAATQNDVLKKIYQQDEFKKLKPNFEKDLSTSIERFIKGLKAS
ncbi:hypothetical protein [Oceanicoccus sp.]|uniref:hypothetical protein n=1 Tax=Oceanicoccus sp. TaxID=2691044 RepID=UPI0034278DDF